MAKKTRVIAEIVSRYTVAANGCWEWTGYRNQQGYGRAMVTLAPGAAKLLAVHRLAYEHHHGPIPAGLLVMHTCDNPPCINPAHLRVGTHAENNDDARAKGRAPPRIPPNTRGQRTRKPYSPPTFRPITFKESLALQIIARRSGGVH